MSITRTGLAAVVLAGALTGAAGPTSYAAHAGHAGHDAHARPGTHSAMVAPAPHRYGANGMRMGLHCDSTDRSTP